MTTISEAAAARIAVDAFTEGLVAALTAKNIEVKGDDTPRHRVGLCGDARQGRIPRPESGIA